VTPDDLYKTILRTITRVRDTRASVITDLHAESLSATNATLDDMARNAAQALIGLLEKPFSAEDVRLHAVIDRLTTCLIGAVDQIQRHNSSANHVTSKEQLEIWNNAITHGRLVTNDGSDPGDE